MRGPVEAGRRTTSFHNPRAMHINADFKRAAVVTPDQYQWVPSPQSGVERVMLDRVGAEKARATSIVRYAAGSRFREHGHPGGEEILVLSGTFSENFLDGQDPRTGHYPAGWYLRSPPGSTHQPFSTAGCTLFVKLWQFPPGDDERVRTDSNDPARWMVRDGLHVCPLFSSVRETVVLQRLAPGQALFPPESRGSAEILVLAGALQAPELTTAPCTQGSWMRLPALQLQPRLRAGESGATVYLKTGHLENRVDGPLPG